MTEFEQLRELLNKRVEILNEIQDLASFFAERIAEWVPDGVAVEIDGYTIATWCYRSCTGGTYKTLDIKPATSQCGWRAISNMSGASMGGVGTILCDENAKIFIANEDMFIFFAKNLERIIDAFEDELKDRAAKLNAAATRLRESS